MSAICKGPECGRAVEAHAVCSGHYQQKRRGRPLSPLRALAPKVSDAERQRMRDEDPCPCGSGRCDMGVADPRHGTRGGYNNRGCRCSACRSAKAEHHASYYADNCDRIAESKARYRADNREKIAESKARYYVENREQIAEYQARYRAANSKRRAEYHARYRAANRARTDEQIAADRAQLRPGGVKDCRKCRESLPLSAFSADRARVDGLSGDCRTCDNTGLLTGEVLASWQERDLYACVYCGLPFEHVDHMHPVQLGGTDDPENLAPACETCNTSKNASNQLSWVRAKAAIIRENHEVRP